ncbi:MAG TPA: UDP-N-acetylmuramate dehydrogenase [Hydrogenispora sp.]|jgi:UDP-N-acetylmuramate dehydrogenase|nr:UDP-N-acetylmuramate dehydrogenase [Hydrogenispora sp.]
MKGENWREALIAEVKPERFRYDESLASYTSFRIGGPADLLVEVNTRTELDKLVSYCEQTGIPWVFLGRGTNVLVDDAGFRGVALRFGPDFARITVDGVRLRAGAAAPLALVAETAARYSLSGLEFASGIPGSLGGGVYMNAGSYGGEMKDVVVAAEVYQPGTGFATLNREELKLGYRTSVLQETGGILVEAVLQLTPGDEATIRAQMKTLNAKRRTKQPLEYPSAGSVFKRPEGAFAGQLIEAAGLKGHRIGQAQVSPKHAGFIVNLGGATARDVLALIEEVQTIVFQRTGYRLEPEIRILSRE